MARGSVIVGGRRLVVLAAASMLLVSGCTSALTGDGHTLGLTNPSAVGAAPAPSAAARAAEGHKLVALLESKPTGASTWTGSWAANVTPTVDQWVEHAYGRYYVKFTEEQLTAQGVVAIAHRTWVAADGDQVDITLLGFRSVAGATSRWLAATHGQSVSADVSYLHIAGGGPTVRAFYHPELDDEGNVAAEVYGHRGRIVCEVFAFTPARLRRPDIAAWSLAQVRRLPS